jgi:hypothetical protein
LNDWLALRERIKVVHKEAVSFYCKVVVLPQNLSKENGRTQEEIYSRDCVIDSELESSASVVRQPWLLVFIFAVGYAVVSAGVLGARRRFMSLAVFNIVFFTQVSMLFGSVLLDWGFG